MKVAILDRQVRQNIALFQHLVEHEAKKRERFFQVAKKAFRTYIHRKTGEMQFPEMEKGDYPTSEWKAILIQLKPEKEGAFEVVDDTHRDHFELNELDTRAYFLLTKTLHILNQLSYDPKKGKNPFWVLRQVADLECMITEEEEGRRNIVHEAWHNVDRAEAEYLLSGSPVGTYLFRKDEYAHYLEEMLTEEHNAPVICISLTYNGWEGKVCEKVLVFIHGKWQIFRDNPDLQEEMFPNVEALLATLENELKSPLYAA